MWLRLFSIAKSLAELLMFRLTSTKTLDVLLLLRQNIERQERISTCIEAVNYLQSAYATDDVITKVTLKIESLKRFSS